MHRGSAPMHCIIINDNQFYNYQAASIYCNEIINIL